MAGQLTIDTLKASSGVLSTQNGMDGIPKAWANFNGTTAAVNLGFNISSITKNSTGNFTLNFATAMPNANYAVTFGVCGGSPNSGFVGSVFSSSQYGGPALKSTTQCQIAYNDYTATVRDFTQLYVAVSGT